ncbi:hypothetical protein CR513_25503, partial [Mucuna pruriens]
MASNTQQFRIKGACQPWMVNEINVVDNLRLENQLIELTSLVRQLVVGQHQPSIAARVCGICTSMEHYTDMCPTLQETELGHPESVGAIGGYQYGKQPYQSQQFDNQYGKHRFWPGRVKGLMWLSDSDLPRMYLKLKVAIGRRVHNTRRHRSNNSNNRECHLKATHHLWRT